MLSYEGIFFDDETVEKLQLLEQRRLKKINDIIHCTFVYHPSDKEIFNDLVGKYYTLHITKYGSSADNSGFVVEIPKELRKYYLNYDIKSKLLKEPHITMSISEKGVPSNTSKLKFIPLDKTIRIKGRFGFWIKNADEEHLSFEKYQIN